MTKMTVATHVCQEPIIPSFHEKPNTWETIKLQCFPLKDQRVCTMKIGHVSRMALYPSIIAIHGLTRMVLYPWAFKATIQYEESESNILWQSSNPVCSSRKSQASSRCAKQHRVWPVPSWRNHIQGWMNVRESYSPALEQGTLCTVWLWTMVDVTQKMECNGPNCLHWPAHSAHYCISCVTRSTLYSASRILWQEVTFWRILWNKMLQMRNNIASLDLNQNGKSIFLIKSPTWNISQAEEEC